MSDPTLQRIWDVREALARRFNYDPYKIGDYYRERQAADKRAKIWKRTPVGDTPAAKSASRKTRRPRKPDPTLQRIWDAREAIARRCDYDIRKITRYHQENQKADKRAKIWKPKPADDTPTAKSASAKPRSPRKPDPVLQRIWDVREALARRFNYDPYKLGDYYRERQAADKRAKIWKPGSAADTSPAKSASRKPRRPRKPDPTLQRIWDAREKIARESDYDSRKLVHRYQAMDKADEQAKKSKQPDVVKEPSDTDTSS